MTPFGERMRTLRRTRGVSQKEMAAALHISPAYLSALEHGRRGRPTAQLVRQICAYFELFWDEAEEVARLAEISHPRITVDTAGLSPEATELANALAEKIERLSRVQVRTLLAMLKQMGTGRKDGP